MFDTEVASLDTVFCGSGRNTRTVEIAIGDLIRLANGRVYPIIR